MYVAQICDAETDGDKNNRERGMIKREGEITPFVPNLRVHII